MHYIYKNLKYDDGTFTVCTGPTNDNVKEVVFHPNTKVIDKKAFRNCYGFENVVFPDSIELIKEQAFENCAIKSADLSNTSARLLNNCFQGCYALKEIKLPKNLTVIPKEGFKGCLSLESIDLSKTKVNLIEESAFEDCTALSEVKKPKSLKTIETAAFKNTKVE